MILIAEDCGNDRNVKDIVSRCKLTDIEACGINQVCVQTHLENEELGDCRCDLGYHFENQDVSYTPSKQSLPYFYND